LLCEAPLHLAAVDAAEACDESISAVRDQNARRTRCFDLAAGLSPSVTITVARKLAIWGAANASERVAVAYLHRSAPEVGHNAVGIRQGGVTAWIHFCRQESRPGGPRLPPSARSGYVITELAVTTEQAGRAANPSQRLLGLGPQEWALFGPNCTTTVRTVLQEAGIVVPAWSRTPFLLHLGVNVGPDITIVGGAAAALSPTT